MSEDGTLGQICPEGWVWDNENSECRCGPPVCPEGYTWDQESRRCQPQPTWPPVQQSRVSPPAAAQALPTTTVAPAAVPTGCPQGQVWVASIGRCISAESAWRYGVGDPPEETSMRAQVINPDGSTEVVEVQSPPGTVGQDNGNGNGEAPAPDGSTTVRVRGFFSPFWSYPIVARYPYPPPYTVYPRPSYPVRLTIFVRSIGVDYNPHGWQPIAVVEVDNIATALQIARCVGGAVGPVGAVAPSQFPDAIPAY